MLKQIVLKQDAEFQNIINMSSETLAKAKELMGKADGEGTGP